VIFYVLVLILLVVGFLFVMFYFKQSGKWLAKFFSMGSVIVFGSKGRGKDLIFQKVINVRKKKCYCCSLLNPENDSQVFSYGKYSMPLPISLFKMGENSFTDIIENRIKKFHSTLLEGCDYYISDGGIYLPSQADSLLSKMYPSFPIAFALSRQWWLMNIHINAQSLNRIWVKLREQADIYIKACGVFKLPFGLLFKVRYYENVESAQKSLKPLKIPHKMLKMMDKQEVKMAKEQYDATHGVIEERYLWLWKKDIFYDTRYFKDIFVESSAGKHSD
jgi:hypothetical protein